MGGRRYYFPEIKENDVLNYVSQLSKQTLREGEKIVEIFRKNFNLIYGKSPDKISILMKQNSQSVFDLSPNSLVISKQQNEDVLRRRKLSNNLTTPVKRNPRFHRKNSLDDSTKESLERPVSETEAVVIRQRRIFSHQDITETTFEPIIDVADIVDDVFVEPTISESPKRSSNLDAKNEEYPCCKSTNGENITVDEKCISPNASNKAEHPDAESEESPRSAQTAKMFGCLNVNDFASDVYLKENIIPDVFPVEYTDDSGEIVKNTVKYTADRESCEFLEDSLESPNFTTKEKHFPSLVKREAIPCRNFSANDFASNEHFKEITIPDVFTDQNTDGSVEIEEITDKYYADKESCEFLEDSLERPNLNINEKYTPSPVKRAKIPCDSGEKSQIQVSVRPVKDLEFGVSLEEEQVWFRGNKVDTSPIEGHLTITISEQKRKSPSPRRNNLLFRAVPRIIRSDENDGLDIELPYESEENTSPLTSSTSPIIFKACKMAENGFRNDVLAETKVEMSSECLQRNLSPSESKSYVCSSQNVTDASTPTGTKGCITRKTISPSTSHSKAISPIALNYQTSYLEKQDTISSYHNISKLNSPKTEKCYISSNIISPSTTTSPKYIEFQFNTKDKMSPIITPDSVSETIKTSSPCKIKDCFRRQIPHCGTALETETSEEAQGNRYAISKQIDESDSNIVRCFMNKLTMLISLRDDCMTEIFESFLEFQKDLNFLFLYVKKIVHTVEKIPTERQGTDEFKTVTLDLIAKSQTLAEKFNLWKIAGDTEVQAWMQYFNEIRSIKSYIKKCNITDASPVEYMRFLRAYEMNLKSIWKNMDGLKILEDARRSSLLNTTSSFETLIKLFVKCLILIGVLNLRLKHTSK